MSFDDDQAVEVYRRTSLTIYGSSIVDIHSSTPLEITLYHDEQTLKVCRRAGLTI